MLTDESLHGRSVLSGDGVVIGEVARLIVDPMSLRIEALQVRVRKDAAERLGVPHGLFRAHTIEISTELVQSIADAVILGVPLEALRERARAPEQPGAPP